MEPMPKIRMTRACQSRVRSLLFASIVAIACLAGCAGGEGGSPLGGRAPDAAVDLVLRGHAYQPSLIRASAGTVLRLRVRNPTDYEHNFTIRKPDGSFLASRDIPVHGKAEINVSLPEKGDYLFRCDMPEHTTLGMLGRIEVR